MLIQEGHLFWRRIKNVFLCFLRTFQSIAPLRRLDQSDPSRLFRNPALAQVTSSWGQRLLKYLNVEIKIEGEPTKEPAIYVGNHMSYLDIIGLLSFKHLCFVAKHEVSTWPIIGPATIGAGCIFVKRESSSSRTNTAQAIREGLESHGKSVCIFPEGTTSVEGKVWRQGAFRIAHETGALVQPMGISYAPARRAAYVDDDMLLTHMFQMVRRDPTVMTVKFFDPVRITDLEADMAKIETQVKKWAKSQLEEQGYFTSEVGYL